VRVCIVFGRACLCVFGLFFGFDREALWCFSWELRVCFVGLVFLVVRFCCGTPPPPPPTSRRPNSPPNHPPDPPPTTTPPFGLMLCYLMFSRTPFVLFFFFIFIFCFFFLLVVCLCGCVFVLFFPHTPRNPPFVPLMF